MVVIANRPPTRNRSARHLPLLLLAILIPSAAVLVLGMKTVTQERELAGKRRADARYRAIADVRQALLARLERARLIETTGDSAGDRPYADSAVVFVARIDSTQVVMPWTTDPDAQLYDHLRTRNPYADLLARAEDAEHRAHDTGTAERFYARARDAAIHPSLAAYAELQALHVVPKSAASIARLTRLAESALDHRDEFGVPLALYAMRALQVQGEQSQLKGSHVVERAERQLLASRQLSPTACHLLAAIVTDANDETIRQPSAVARCQELDTADSLISEISRILMTARGSPKTIWTWLPGPGWFLSTSATADGRRIAVVVRKASISKTLPLEPATARIVATPDEGDPIGPPFSGVFVKLRPIVEAGDDGSLKSWFYGAGLALVMSLAGIAAFLLWRDVRRESELTALRAEFVSSVSHELKTPLTAIRMYADTLLLRTDLDQTARAEYLGTIVGESERLTRLLNNVLDFSRIERGGKMYQLRSVDLATLTRGVARTMAHPLKQQGFTLTLTAPTTPIVVQADQDAIEQVILNLLVNAMKYSGESRSISVALDVHAREAVVSITDRGIGIATADHERIFQRFYRVATTDGSRQPGAGLGLTIVRHAIDAHGGRVVVRSSLGEGSTFALHIPLESPDRAVGVELRDSSDPVTIP